MDVYSAFNDNVFVYDRKYPSYYFQRKTTIETLRGAKHHTYLVR